MNWLTNHLVATVMTVYLPVYGFKLVIAHVGHLLSWRGTAKVSLYVLSERSRWRVLKHKAMDQRLAIYFLFGKCEVLDRAEVALGIGHLAKTVLSKTRIGRSAVVIGEYCESMKVDCVVHEYKCAGVAVVLVVGRVQ